jgi:hypothetical protein
VSSNHRKQIHVDAFKPQAKTNASNNEALQISRRSKSDPCVKITSGFKVPHSHQQSEVMLVDDKHVMLPNQATVMSMGMPKEPLQNK